MSNVRFLLCLFWANKNIHKSADWSCKSGAFLRRQNNPANKAVYEIKILSSVCVKLKSRMSKVQTSISHGAVRIKLVCFFVCVAKELFVIKVLQGSAWQYRSLHCQPHEWQALWCKVTSDTLPCCCCCCYWWWWWWQNVIEASDGDMVNANAAFGREWDDVGAVSPKDIIVVVAVPSGEGETGGDKWPPLF